MLAFRLGRLGAESEAHSGMVMATEFVIWPVSAQLLEIGCWHIGWCSRCASFGGSTRHLRACRCRWLPLFSSPCWTGSREQGYFLDPGEPVAPDVPKALHPLPSPSSGPVNRLVLAKWLVDRKNPLTARVAVNRYWAQLFGTGIVETEEDFGTQGELPSHPALLDWLAGRPVHGVGLGHQGDAQADRDLGNIPPVVTGDSRAAGSRPAQPVARPSSTDAARGRDGSRPGTDIERPLEPQQRLIGVEGDGRVRKELLA